jgi:hypothetical protein
MTFGSGGCWATKAHRVTCGGDATFGCVWSPDHVADGGPGGSWGATKARETICGGSPTLGWRWSPDQTTDGGCHGSSRRTRAKETIYGGAATPGVGQLSPDATTRQQAPENGRHPRSRSSLPVLPLIVLLAP